ncbi:MAG: pyridoxal phosphate-dependent aminotransferase [Planctomycetota bacterium]|jgi:aspartate/methionine/tyrosine aminotransferase
MTSPGLSRRASEVPASATVALADLATEMRARGEDVVDLTAGRASEACPDAIIDAAVAAMRAGDTHQTQARGTAEYRRMVAKKLARENGIEADPGKNIVATLGCKNGLVLALTAILDPGDEVIIEDPAFVSYAPTIHYLGGHAKTVPLPAEQNYRWRREDLLPAVSERCKAILFCSPQNPTGIVHSREDLECIAEIARERDLFVIVDEVYERMTWGGREHLCIGTLPGMAERTIDLMSLTKSHAMGGWRIGFAHGPETVIDAMVQVQAHLTTCAGSFTQAGAALAFGEDPEPGLLELWQDWEGRCKFVAQALASVPGVRCAVPEAGYYAWVDLRAVSQDSAAVADMLLREHKVAVVPGRAFGSNGEGFIRVTCVKSWDIMREAVARLSTGLGSLARSES